MARVPRVPIIVPRAPVEEGVTTPTNPIQNRGTDRNASHVLLRDDDVLLGEGKRLEGVETGKGDQMETSIHGVVHTHDTYISRKETRSL